MKREKNSTNRRQMNAAIEWERERVRSTLSINNNVEEKEEEDVAVETHYKIETKTISKT